MNPTRLDRLTGRRMVTITGAAIIPAMSLTVSPGDIPQPVRGASSRPPVTPVESPVDTDTLWRVDREGDNGEW